MSTLQARLAGDAGGGENATPDRPTIADPVAFLHGLVTSRRFHRDTGLGRLYHPGCVSLRENRPADSLHIVVSGDHISAHVDKVSPLDKTRPRYSVRAAAAHNIAGAAQDLVRLLRGRKGDHRAHLDCAWQWEAGAGASPDPTHLVPPEGWSVHLEACVEGTLDERRLRKAFDAVLGHRPGAADPLDVVSADDLEALAAARAELLAAPVPMTEWPPLRARLVHRPEGEGDVLLLNVNHGAGDGFAARCVLESIAAAYAEGDTTGPPLDFLAVNDLPVVPTSAAVSRAGALYRDGVEWLRDRLARPARLAPDGGEDRPGYGFHSVALSVADTRRVANVHRQGTARNVLLAALHLAIGEWNLDHGTPGRQVGVLVPVDLRPPEWAPTLLGNLSVTARVSTSRRHRSGPRAALRAITAQKDRNKRFRTGVALLTALERNALLGLWAKQSQVVLQPLTRNRGVDTAMLANAGWFDPPPSFGDEAGATTAVWYSLPARSPECLCIGAATVAGRLHLTFRYPHRLFGPEAARRFAGFYVDQIVTVAERRW